METEREVVSALFLARQGGFIRILNHGSSKPQAAAVMVAEWEGGILCFGQNLDVWVAVVPVGRAI